MNTCYVCINWQTNNRFGHTLFSSQYTNVNNQPEIWWNPQWLLPFGVWSVRLSLLLCLVLALVCSFLEERYCKASAPSLTSARGLFGVI
jgi:hypothetical protein